MAFPRLKIAVFLDGCWWHSCPLHRSRPRRNADWWEAKLLANVERDRRNTISLEAAGWKVIRIWEHEPLEEAVARVLEAVGRKRQDRVHAESA